MMNFKNWVSLCCALSLLTSTAAYSAAMRTDTKQENSAAAPGKVFGDALLYQDFTSVEPGSLPAGVSGGKGETGYVDTELYEVAPGRKKNCLIVNDLSFDNNYSGASSTISPGSCTGMIGVEIRYMIDVPDGAKSAYSAFPMQLLDQSGALISGFVIASSNGSSHFNYGGADELTMENETITPNNWYTIKWIIDFDKQRMDFSFLNEGNKTVNAALDCQFYGGEAAISNELAKIKLESQLNGGKWVFDYVAVTKEKKRLEINEEELSIQKGVSAELIAAPAPRPSGDKINIYVDGRYKYPTAQPFAADGGAVLATAKNLAGFCCVQYFRNGSVYTVQSGENKLVIQADQNKAECNGKSVALTGMQQKENQLYIPIAEFCRAFGYEYSFDSGASSVYITTVKAAEEGGEGDED